MCLSEWIKATSHLNLARQPYSYGLVQLHLIEHTWIDCQQLLGGAPYDGAVRNELHSNNIWIVIVYCIAACTGLVYTLVCFLFNIIFRRNKLVCSLIRNQTRLVCVWHAFYKLYHALLSCRYVKLSSPNLNHLIIVGAAILYTTVVLYVFSVNDEDQGQLQTVLCNVSSIMLCYSQLHYFTSLQIRQWLFSLGYTLCFAVILAKTWRIYYIFNNPTSKKKVKINIHWTIM